jgi:hypothetical protein
MTIQCESIVQFTTIEQLQGSYQRYTEKALLRNIQDHHHQMRVQELDSSGRFSAGEYPRMLLRQARNLGIDLNEAIHGSQRHAREEGKEISTKVLEYFFPEGDKWQSLEVESAFVDCISQSRFCRKLLGLKGSSLHNWNQKWKPMSEDAGVNLNRLASQVFGSLAVPYPDMSVSYFHVRFNPGQHAEDSILLRITTRGQRFKNASTASPLSWPSTTSALKAH